MRRAKWTVVMVVAAAMLGGARQAHAQLGWTAYGAAEFDTKDVILILGGVDVSAHRSGWSPMAGIQAFWLQYGSNVKTNVTSVMPSVGLQNVSANALTLFRVGYAFQNDDSDVNPGVFANVGSGIVTAAQYEYWGTGKMGAQLIGSYNFGSETFWGRARVTARVARIGDGGAIKIGPEVAYLRTSTSDGLQAGGVAVFNGRGVSLGVGIGEKITPLQNRSALVNNDATYFRFEIAMFPK